MSELKDPRVLFAAERTLLAWNRTGLSLVGFGFLIERTGLLLKVVIPNLAEHAALTFWIGLAFIALGSASALYASREYAIVLKSLNPEEFPPGYSPRWGMMVNTIVAVLGFVLVVVLYQGHP